MPWNGEEVLETERFVFFWKPPAVFSQWARSDFEVDGFRYTHAEQYMMAEKARIFGDDAMLERILVSQSPSEQKKLGQAVRGFDQDVWFERRMEIVERGNRAKFGQSPKRCDALLATGDKTLAEASPLDCIWGIGLAADHADAEVPSRWRGQNLLGQALMNVRDDLRSGAHRE